MSLPQVILRVIQQHNLIPQNSRIVVAVSGGLDSLVLLHLLIHLRAALSCEIHVATLDHGLRGPDSAGDMRYVQDIARRWNVPITVKQADVNAYAAEQRLNIEAAARQVRYAFLVEVAQAVDAAHIAVAHHADDQAETILMHLVRGSGLRGLSGMHYKLPLPQQPDLFLIRPLLSTLRSAIEQYGQTHKIHPRHDKTNDDRSLLRNYIRLEIIPHLKSLNPQISRVLGQLGTVVAQDDNFIQAELASVVAQHAEHGPGYVQLKRQVFESLHPALQHRFIVWAAETVRGIPGDLDFEHVAAAVELALAGRLGARGLLGARLQMRVDYEVIVVEYDERPAYADNVLQIAPNTELVLVVPGHLELEAKWCLDADFTSSAQVQARLYIPVGAQVLVRTRRPGDRFAPLGMGGHSKKLAHWMIDHKIPQRLRDCLPLLTINGEIAAIMWGEAWPISAHYAVSESLASVVYFSLQHRPPE